jgi:hypothetical protein
LPLTSLLTAEFLLYNFFFKTLFLPICQWTLKRPFQISPKERLEKKLLSVETINSDWSSVNKHPLTNCFS